MPPHPLTNVKILKMNINLMVFIQENLPKIKDGAYGINLDEYESIGTQELIG